MNLKSQIDILASWQDPDRCIVSVCMLAYNHEPYVRDALEGVLRQETDFAFEILLHDDASTDRTAHLIREYADRYPRLVKPIFQTTNQLSQGVKVSVEFNFPRVRGDFVAICECDDYWNDPHKLAKQVAAMRQHPECGICFHPARQIDCSPSAGSDKIIGRYRESSGHLPPEDIVLRRAGPVPTASCLIARNEFDEYVDFRKCHPHMTGDVAMQFFGARRGGALYLNDVMSVYRWFSQSSWTKNYRSNAAVHEQAMFQTYRDLDVFTHRMHAELIASALLTRLIWYFQFCRHDRPERYAAFRRAICERLAPLFEPRLVAAGPWLIYGTGLSAEIAIEKIPPDRIAAVLDQDPLKHGILFGGYPVKPPGLLAEMPEATIVVALPGRAAGIIDDLSQRFGVPESRFVSMDAALAPLVDDFNPTADSP